jgi:hypothetical protein
MLSSYDEEAEEDLMPVAEHKGSFARKGGGCAKSCWLAISLKDP